MYASFQFFPQRPLIPPLLKAAIMNTLYMHVQPL